MKKSMSLVLILLLAAAGALAHAGHAHTYMGTVTMLHSDGSFMMTTTTGKELTILVSPKTVFIHSDDHAAEGSELAVGQRVVVKMMTDGKTAASVKMSAPKKS